MIDLHAEVTGSDDYAHAWYLKSWVSAVNDWESYLKEGVSAARLDATGALPG